MASFPILEITDGSTTISLLGPFFSLESWRPAIAQAKGGGTFQSSPLADGRRLVNRRFENAIETFDLSAHATTQDSFAEQHQELERLLMKAVRYHVTTWQNTPVYLKCKTPCETEPRYALIHTFGLPSLNQVFRRPFAGRTTGMVGFSLTLERGHWLADVPGEETCIQVSGMGAEGHESSLVNVFPILHSDDANYDSTGALTLAATTLLIGDAIAAIDFDALLRFQDVDIPQGSIIVQAYVRMKAAANDGGAPVLQIYGQDSDDADTFTTAANWEGRPATLNAVAWNPGAWVAGNFYNTSDISTIVQEIVNRPDWASGNNMVIAINDNGSPLGIHREFYAADHAVEPAAQLYVDFLSSEGAGRTATCLPEVYITNKHNYRGLTHVWYDDAGVGFSVNLLGTALPYNLLPAGPAVGDIIYFGIEDGPLATITGGGPFFSLVFDLITAQTGVTFGNGWEYSLGGAAWAALTVQDNTDTGGQPLDTAGVNSVHWQEPTNWAVDVINLVNAYWVRLEVTAIAAPIPPIQQLRDVYTILWPRVEVDELQIEGDISALLRAVLDNQARYSSAADISRVILALRSNERGLDFTPYLNCSDQQEIPGIAISVPGAPVTILNDVRAPTERAVQWNPGVLSAMSWRIRWTFTDVGGIIAPILQWYGSFHAFARVYQTAGAAANFSVQLVVDIGDQDYSSSTIATVGNVGFTEVLDLGRLDIPDGTGILNTTEVLDTLIIELHASAAAAGTIKFYDLVLMPADEMLLDAQIQTEKLDGGATQLDELLNVDSVLYPKAPVRSFVRDTNDAVMSIWRTKGPLAFLQANADQRLWFFLMKWDAGIPVGWVGRFSMGARVQAWGNRRYLSLRGER